MVTNVIIRKVEHRGSKWFSLKFKFDTETIQLVKGINCSKWSETYKTWLIPFEKASVDKIKTIFSEIDYADEECRDLLDLAPQNKTLPEQDMGQSVKLEIKPEGDEVFSCEGQDYIYLKTDPFNQKDRSFLAGLEYSRNYIQSGYWKIKNTNGLEKKLTNYFSGRLKRMDTLIEEILKFEAKRKNRKKVLASIEGKRVKVVFEWNKELVDFLKKMPFHTWDPDTKSWTFAYNEKTLCALKEFCIQKKLDLEVDDIPVLKRVSKRAIGYHDPAYKKCPIEMVDSLKNRRYSESTIKQYTSMFEEFINFHNNIPIEELSNAHIKEFINYLVQVRRVSPSYQNVSVNAIKFYYEKILGQPRTYIEYDRPRKEKHLPEVISRDDVISMISSITNLKHKFILVLLYSTGLRRGELLNLKTADIDCKNMQIWVRGGKGKKDRYVQLGKNTLKVLDEYIKLYNPQEYLIEGRGDQYSVSSMIEIIKNAARKAGVSKRITPHKFRHSYATHLLEDGVDIRFIQELLGHGSIKTTQIYLHVTDKNIKNIVNPIDKMEI
jgi:integrase/recombinase XerD